MMRLFDSLEIAGSSLTAHRLWMDLISQNLANVNTTRRLRAALTNAGFPSLQSACKA